MSVPRWMSGVGLSVAFAGAVLFGQVAAGGQAAAGPVGRTPNEQAVEADPALWKVKGAHGTVYLFGSVHVMKPTVKWQTAKVQAAMKTSDSVYLEIENIDDAAAAQPMILQLGMDAAHPLSTKISKEDVAVLEAQAKELGMGSEAAFEPMQPWLVYVTMSVVPMMKAGFDPGSGIDHVLLTQAKSEGKAVKGFETIKSQLHMLADFSQADQVAMLHEELVNLPKSTAQMNEMVADWERGDVEAIGKLENDETAAKYPALYQRLVVERNKKWATKLEEVLKDEHTGTVFVVVGAAHLAGPDSVQKMLEKDGYAAVRQ